VVLVGSPHRFGDCVHPRGVWSPELNDQVKRALLDAFTAFLIEEVGKGIVAKATDFEERHVESGYCDTCYDQWTEVEITYDRINGGSDSFFYYGSLADLMQKLT
jgi:hypothetical protein